MILFVFFSITNEHYITSTAVEFTPENQVTMEAGQRDPNMPNGPELTQIDESYIGQNVFVEKTPKVHVHDSSCQDKC